MTDTVPEGLLPEPLELRTNTSPVENEAPPLLVPLDTTTSPPLRVDEMPAEMEMEPPEDAVEDPALTTMEPPI